ncbi:hypothetical protein FB192DRAFT_1140250 [Mucor lusitanicus]|uniref:C2H2-type domain-containing protein n=1 Tax=Mucor circinelloides f. lusitanicus TaxID=29924 RepID=A0A8H4EZ10_MUCCL|nr:hypothetical protein FB192DRAFT_1140250 [Mucor lusitanicus]
MVGYGFRVQAFPCPICTWTFKRKTHLFGHLRIVHDVEPPHEYECDRTDCMEDFVTSRALYYHQRDAHPEIPCGCCCMSFVSVDKLNKHATSYHKNAASILALEVFIKVI